MFLPSSGILQKGNPFVRNVEEDNRSTQHTTCTNDLHIQNVCNTDQNKDQHLPADSPESHFAGELLLRDGTHYPRQIIGHYKDHQCNHKSVAAAKEIAQPAPRLQLTPFELHSRILSFRFPRFLIFVYKKSDCPFEQSPDSINCYSNRTLKDI